MIDRPLWKLLLDSLNPTTLAQRPLTCRECFTILEYLADLFSQKQNLVSPKVLQQAAQHHLETCPDCQAYYQRRLEELEAYQEDVHA